MGGVTLVIIDNPNLLYTFMVLKNQEIIRARDRIDLVKLIGIIREITDSSDLETHFFVSSGIADGFKEFLEDHLQAVVHEVDPVVVHNATTNVTVVKKTVTPQILRETAVILSYRTLAKVVLVSGSSALLPLFATCRSQGADLWIAATSWTISRAWYQVLGEEKIILLEDLADFMLWDKDSETPNP